ncbi:uncharacterized protein [Pempheris klunzingeri]|uniref:uncharacterized protein n=1 Tax=Pempheris klunzingeri TaxID=3127111 RepID=UPI003980CF9D
MKQEVDHYSVAVTGCTGAQMVLSVRLINPIMHHNSQGQTVKLSFSCEHQRELEEAAGRVFMREQSPLPIPVSGGLVQVPPPAGQLSPRSYSRKRRLNWSQLRILPLSSPSSEEDSSLTKVVDRRCSESLFDHVRHSTPSYDSGVPVGAEPETSQEQTEDFGGSSSPLKKDGFICERKRVAPLSGYLSDQTEGLSACKRKTGPQSQGEGPDSPLTGSPPQGAGAQPEDEELFAAGAWSPAKRMEPVMELGAEPQSDITSGITAAFNGFKTQLEEHLTGCWQDAETQVLLSLKEFQQQVSTLLTAVHQHRLLSLQTFLIGITDQLDRLKDTSADLNSISTHILSFFQSEIQRLGSFCDQHLDRLKSSGLERPSSQ